MNINVNVNINVNFDSLEEFKKFCKVLYLEREYPNHLGNADWLIISDLSEEEIQRRFSEVLSKYIPYILVNSEVGEQDRFFQDKSHTVLVIHIYHSEGYVTELQAPTS